MKFVEFNLIHNYFKIMSGFIICSMQKLALFGSLT